MLARQQSSMPYLTSLATCLDRMVSAGYTEDFEVTEKGLVAPVKKDCYTPEEIQAIHFFRFEGPSDPHDNAILYVIETNDGTKGTLIDAQGSGHQPGITRFIQDVETIRKARKN